MAEEIRRNASTRIAAGEPLVTGVLGFDDSVLPQLENARAGRARRHPAWRARARPRRGSFVRWSASSTSGFPIVAHSEINDDPYHPVSRFAKDLLAEAGDDLPVSWVHRSDRYGEKLATPDTSIADLIGEVDPIRVAEGRYLSDELTIHYGLVPRLNRGIFAVNELPDLAERIQVGLLNVLEERDVQIRGHRVRLPLDIVLVATANPEDYTNRGRIITPLKDRFGAQIRTHYPPDADTEFRIAELEAELPGRNGSSARPGGEAEGRPQVEVPDFMAEIVAELSQLARESPHLNQRSGVSVRLTISNYETLVANATRRALRLGEPEAVPRISDLQALVSSTQGKVEIESLEEGREEIILASWCRRRCCSCSAAAWCSPTRRRGRFVHRRDRRPRRGRPAGLRLCRDPGPDAGALGPGARAGRRIEDPGVVASAVEFILEGLHLTKRLNKEAAGPRAHLPGPGMTWRFDYRRWDGTQDSLVDDTDSVLSQLTDDLLANGDLHEALQRMLNRGWRTPDGEPGPGSARAPGPAPPRAGGGAATAATSVAPSTRSPRSCNEVVAEEREGIDALEADARSSG